MRLRAALTSTLSLWATLLSSLCGTALWYLCGALMRVPLSLIMSSTAWIMLLFCMAMLFYHGWRT